MVKIVIHYASESDLSHVLEVERAMEKILGQRPEECDVYVDRRCASAHKTPDYLLEVLESTKDCDVRGVVLGRQPAAPPAIDANCQEPVITFLTDGKGNPDQIYSSLNVPSGVACMTAPPWHMAMALALLKVAAVKDNALKGYINLYQDKNRDAVKESDIFYGRKPMLEAQGIFEDREKKRGGF